MQDDTPCCEGLLSVRFSLEAQSFRGKKKKINTVSLQMPEPLSMLPDTISIVPVCIHCKNNSWSCLDTNVIGYQRILLTFIRRKNVTRKCRNTRTGTFYREIHLLKWICCSVNGSIWITAWMFCEALMVLILNVTLLLEKNKWRALCV